ncbi:hypothetical protein, partial [Longispora fulva]|uniref:hypothetical protein n=2 Tax=Bacteria TaxID=2 RepID=UPI003639CECC
LHGAHEMNPNYTYDDLMEIVKAYQADVIGVEIRQEDMALDNDTLDKFYPLEFIQIRDSFPGKVAGIDFYSPDTRDETVNIAMFRDTVYKPAKIKYLGQLMKTDSVLVQQYEKAGIPEIQQEQMRIALNYSAEEFLKGEYDSLTRQQYLLEDSLFENSKYAEYSEFNKNRDSSITENALDLIQNNPSKKVLILVGANHRNRIMQTLEAQKRENIELITDLSFMN